MELQVSKASPPLGALFVAEATIPGKYTVAWGTETKLKVDHELIVTSSGTICRYLARQYPTKLYGSTIIERTEVDHWLTFSAGLQVMPQGLPQAITQLDAALSGKQYLVGQAVTMADFSVWGVLFLNSNWHNLIADQKAPASIQKWFRLIGGHKSVQKVVENLPTEVKPQVASGGGQKQKDVGKFVDLPGASMGNVVVRFPPEASGYLHIGHAKAALLNQYYQQMFEGTLIMRFDDTNPAKEKADFEKVILEDLELLQVKYDKFSHTSDHFDLCLSLCEKLIKEGIAYADDTEPETMKLEREQKKDSKNRNASVAQNLKIWEEMKKGTAAGQKYCIRVKIDMQSVNGCMRDPTIYRCKNEPHVKTGDKYKVYPTYDFACPIVDSLEGVTHALRTTEYHDRDAQYYWFCDALGLRKPHIYEYARLCMNNTVLSKRKLTWFVDEGHVDGWDDPRMPTVRGVLRRGMTVEGLRQFIVAQGSSRSVVNMGWDKIWSFNKKVVDPIAPRFTAIEKKGAVPVFIAGAKEEAVQAQKHPKDEKIGMKTVWTGPKVLIDGADAETLKEGENATFINYGNVLIKKIHRKDGKVEKIDAEANIENKDYKKTTKLTWLADTTKVAMVPTLAIDFDHLINKPVLDRDEDFKKYIGHETRFETEMLGDPELRLLKKGDIIQLQRKGFFVCDEPWHISPYTSIEHPLVLFAIPDGKETTAQTPAPAAAKKAEVKAVSAVASGKASNTSDLNNKLVAQGDYIRELKSDKAEKAVIDVEVKKLLALKAEYKAATGSEWKPTAAPLQVKAAAPAAVPAQGKTADQLNSEITAQGEAVRDLKAKKADKASVDAAVKLLLSLKAEYKALVGSDWKPGAAPSVVQATAPAQGKTADQLSAEVAAQGDKVRDLKVKKADKASVDAAVKSLLSLKAEYKTLTGADWKPAPASSAVQATAPAQGKTAEQLGFEVAAQGDTVRDLKAKKADKASVDAAVKSLLSLKAEYKTLTGADWKPAAAPSAVQATAPAQGTTAEQLSAKVAVQGDTVRDLKAKKADKASVDAAVKLLLSLKAEYKTLTGADWKPAAAPSAAQATAPAPSAVQASAPAQGQTAEQLSVKVAAQGDTVRDLKAKKADKASVDTAVKSLLSLKAEYKTLTGADWKPAASPPVQVAAPAQSSAPAAVMTQGNGPQSAEEELLKKVQQQGEKVRDAKTKKAPKDEVDREVAALLAFKKQYKDLTGKDVPAAAPARAPSKPVAKKEEKKAEPKKAEKKATEEDSAAGQKKQTRLGIEAKKEENLPEWYSQVITKSELIEYYDVSGCYILRPWAYSIWESIRDFFDGEIKKLGVKNCYFPIFVSRAALEREKEHIADFAPEVAWVTKSGDSELAEPIAIRPTSETVMYPAYAKWIQSYRDLPMKLNQWNNVVRWEFKHPQPFLRTREFLWQEGHTAFATREEAVTEVHQILDLYAQVYNNLLAIPVVKGRKTEKEKFAGADFTTTVEAFVPASGRGIQGATSHLLGQNFSKMFDIGYEHPETKERTHVWQNSWGLTTRTIGVLVMVHADNKGLVLPPPVACTQVIIVPCGITAETKDADRDAHYELCRNLEKELKDGGIRAEGDYRDNYSPGWKYSHWELKGVPIRVELGPRDIKKNEFVAVRRDTGDKLTFARSNAAEQVSKLLTTIHASMLAKATAEMNEHIVKCLNFGDFVNELDKKNLILAPSCGDKECEENIKKESAREESAEPGAPAMGAKSLCSPFEQPEEIKDGMKCVHPRCSLKPVQFTLFGRSY